MKILELLTQLDKEVPGADGCYYWHITLHGDGSGELFEPGDHMAMVIFSDIQHLENIIAALLHHKPQTSEHRLAIAMEVNE